MEVREFVGVFFGGLIALALVATVLNKNSKTAEVATAFANGFAADIRAATFQGSPAPEGG